MAKWKEIEFANALTMATNPVNPSRKTAQRLLNVQTHVKPGALTLRPGYTLKYDKPTDDTITNDDYINFDMFFDRAADPLGSEVTCQIQKGTLEALDNSGSPIVADTQDMICLWVRPYWDGTQWVGTAWQWLNHTFITKVTTASDGTYQNMIVMFGATDQSIAEDSLIGYTIYNKTKGEYAKIITNKVVDATHTRINHTLFDSTWEEDDVLIISRHWIDVDYHAELYTAAWYDAQFHRIINDLRIGFGGYENRPGLAVGFRDTYLMIKDVNFSELHGDLDADTSGKIDDAVLAAFNRQNKVILDTHILRNDNSAYGIKLETKAGTLDAGTYYFRLTGKVDGYGEHLVADASKTVGGSDDIIITPFIDMGRINPRVTDLTIFWSDDNINFYKMYDIIVRKSTAAGKTWTLQDTGKIEEKPVIYGGDGEYHLDSNAARLVASGEEIDSTGEWENIGIHGHNVVLESAASYDGISPHDAIGGYLLVLRVTNPYYWNFKIKSPPLIASLTQLTINFWIYIDGAGTSTIRITSAEGGQRIDVDVTDGVWQEVTVTLYVAGSIEIEKIEYHKDYILIDELSVTNFNTVESFPKTNEMERYLGYYPTYEMVRGWDQAIKFRGQVYYLNPYVDKRYINFVSVSAIKPTNAFQYDIASFDKFLELELPKSNRAIGMEVLDTYELLILYDQAVSIIDPYTGARRSTKYGVKCTSLNSIQNINGRVFFCGEEDIYFVSSSNYEPKALLENTIRNIYVQFPNKNLIIGIRDKYNTYRIRPSNSVTKQEFLLTENGVNEEKKQLFAEAYRIDQYGDINFMNDGNIYAQDAAVAGVLLDDADNYLIDDADAAVIL